MKQFIRDYLTFHGRERRGILVLLTIVVLLLIYLQFSHLLFSSTEKIDFSIFEKQMKAHLDSINQQLDSIDEAELQNKSGNNFREEKPLGIKGERFYFNPNSLPDKDWQRLGLSEKQIKVINNYQSKGGKFRSKADVKKMYCIKEELYVSLEPYISIPEKKKDTLSHQYIKHDTIKPEIKIPKPELAPVELNSADSLSLIKIRGIKGFYAKKIIEHRNELGGYVTKEQLMELWKFDQDKFDGVEKYVSVDATKLKKININTCTSKELKHPYLNWNMVNGIISYRSKHGKFTTISDIKKTDLVDDETYRKIAPYLSLE